MKNRIQIQFNNYVKLDPTELLYKTNKWITNGIDNTYFNTVENAYLGSPTNQSIIDNFSNYILGEGLYDINNLLNVESILNDEDLRNAVTDYKTQGACAFQVIYNFEKKPVKLYYVPVKCLAVNREADISEDPSSYWYSFDWRFRNKYRPEQIPAYGKGDKTTTEILYIKRHSAQPVYTLPDWQSGIQYTQVEEELSNYYKSHIKNGFSAGKIININQGGTDSEEAMMETKKVMNRELTGSSAAGVTIYSFNDNYENRTTVESIEITDAYSQFQFLSAECRTMIMMAHKVNDPSLFGLPLPSGFNSAAEQMVQSLKILYRSQIKPSRKIIINQLNKVFKSIEPNSDVAFLDFEELRITKSENNIV
jgi:hypothetical protein